jgi:hypothetical protein
MSVKCRCRPVDVDGRTVGTVPHRTTEDLQVTPPKSVQSAEKTAQLEEALRGFFTDHHATILKIMLDNGDQIAALDAQIEDALRPFSGRRPACPASLA